MTLIHDKSDMQLTASAYWQLNARLLGLRADSARDNSAPIFVNKYIPFHI